MFERNFGSLIENEVEQLSNIKVLVIGCGGSGYLVDMLTRLGIGHIGIVDGDIYEASNLNRQMLCNQATISREKAVIASEYMTGINPKVVVEAYTTFINQENSVQIITKYDYIFDCTDNMRDKRIIQNTCNECNKPLIFGGMSRWICHVGISLPGQDLVNKIFGNREEPQIPEKEKLLRSSTTGAINALLSSLYVSAFLNHLFRWNHWNRVYVLDLKNMKVAHFNPLRKGFLIFRKW